VSAAAAALGRELTRPGVSQSVVLTRLAGRTAESMPIGEGPGPFAVHGATMAVFLSAARPEELAAELLAPGSGYGPETPAAIVIRVSWPDERILPTTVGRLAADLRASGATMTVLVLVGEALAGVGMASGRRTRLYEPAFSTAYRLRSEPGSTEGRPSARRPASSPPAGP
jgi:precorrin-4/cobalt-precorrin-4 C11-methyltransferase